jgi:hypothetical protein
VKILDPTGTRTPTSVVQSVASRYTDCAIPAHNLKQGLLEKSKLDKHAYEEGHKVGWDEARVLDIESHRKYRKYKEAAHMACYIDPISQPSLDISPIWIPIINNEANTSQRRSI